MLIHDLLNKDHGEDQLVFTKVNDHKQPNGIAIRDDINGIYINKVPKIRNKYYAIMYDRDIKLGFLFIAEKEYGYKYRYNNILTLEDILLIMNDLERLKIDHKQDTSVNCAYGPYDTLTHKFINGKLYGVFKDRYIKDHMIDTKSIPYLMDVLHELYLLYGK